MIFFYDCILCDNTFKIGFSLFSQDKPNKHQGRNVPLLSSLSVLSVSPDASLRQLTLTLLPHHEIRLKELRCPSDVKLLHVLNSVWLF